MYLCDGFHPVKHPPLLKTSHKQKDKQHVTKLNPQLHLMDIQHLQAQIIVIIWAGIELIWCECPYRLVAMKAKFISHQKVKVFIFTSHKSIHTPCIWISVLWFYVVCYRPKNIQIRGQCQDGGYSMEKQMESIHLQTWRINSREVSSVNTLIAWEFGCFPDQIYTQTDINRYIQMLYQHKHICTDKSNIK